MVRSYADRVLEEWNEVSRLARRPGVPVRSITGPALKPGSTLATATVLVVALTAAGLWFNLQRTPGDAGTSGSATPSPSTGPASWWVDPTELPLSDDAEVIRGFIRERACASGRSPEGRVLEPTIEYGADSIVITYMVEMRPGDCPGNPSLPVEIRLVEPLGGRMLLDGSEDPPRDATMGDPEAALGRPLERSVARTSHMTGESARPMGTARNP